jgi:hypothetical protein
LNSCENNNESDKKRASPSFSLKNGKIWKKGRFNDSIGKRKERVKEE